MNVKEYNEKNQIRYLAISPFDHRIQRHEIPIIIADENGFLCVNSRSTPSIVYEINNQDHLYDLIIQLQLDKYGTK